MIYDVNPPTTLLSRMATKTKKIFLIQQLLKIRLTRYSEIFHFKNIFKKAG